MAQFKSGAAPTSLDRGRVADQIFKELRDSIVLGTIPQGAKLPSERELAQQYGVSGPTVREAIRGLSLLGFADVRHGSGMYVNADTSSLIATSLSAVIQLGKLGVSDVLGVFGALYEHAASLAAQLATRDDQAQIRAALDALHQANTSEESARAALNFHNSIAAAANNPLLKALCGFLAELQVELGLELCRSVDDWRRILLKLRPVRTELVEAIIRRDREAAAILAREFGIKAAALITSLPKAKEVRLNDPKLRALLSSMIARVEPN